MKYKPVKHTAEDYAKKFANPKIKAAYDALEDEYAALDARLTARRKAVQRKTSLTVKNPQIPLRANK